MSLSIGQEVWIGTLASLEFRGTIVELERIGYNNQLSCRVEWEDEIVSWCMAESLHVVSPLQLLAEQAND